jgi:uncharacterized repeat protein (TIGR03809 family)
MSEQEKGPYGTVARKWLALVERRQEHFIELCDTGRWRHYYTKDEFLEEMRKVLRVRDQWASIAGLPPPSGDPAFFRNAQTPHRLLPNRLVPLNLTPADEPRGEAGLQPVDLPPVDLPPVKVRVNALLASRWPD